MRQNDLDDFLSDLTVQRDAETAWDIGQRYLASLGFDLCSYQFGDWDRNPGSPYRAKTNKELDWVKKHFANLSPETEPLLSMGCNRFEVQPMGLSFMKRTPDMPKLHRFFLERLADSDWRSIIAFPLRLRGTGPFGGWGLTQAKCGAHEFMKLVRANGAKARLAAFYVHERMGPLAEAHAGAALSPRQRDCLLHLAAGLRQAQIADQLGISLATVEFHLRAARRNLAAKTNTEAISRAVLGQIIVP